MNPLKCKDIIDTSPLKYDMEAICEKEYGYFLCKENVLGVSIGSKISNGEDTFKDCLTVLVSKKLPECELSPEDMIPEKYKGILTDVIETGEIMATSLTDKVRPIIFGYSIGPDNSPWAGTAGYLTKDYLSNLYILSNNHVLAGENKLPINTPILQPSLIDGGTSSTDKIATLSKFVPIKFETQNESPENFVDAAISKFINPVSDANDIIYLNGRVSGLNLRPRVRLRVKKVGRTTEETTGEIRNTNATVRVTYSDGNTAIFLRQIITTSMSKPGDSGSLLLDRKNNALGLLFAGSDSATIYNPINLVLRELSISI